MAWGSEGARGGGKNERLRPDSTRELRIEGCAGSVREIESGVGVGECAWVGGRRVRGKHAKVRA